MTVVLAILIFLAATFVLYRFFVKHREAKKLDQATYIPPVSKPENIVVEVSSAEVKLETSPATVEVKEEPKLEVVAPKKAKKAKAKSKTTKTTKTNKKPKIEVVK